MNYDDKHAEPEIREEASTERRSAYTAPFVETIARAEYMALLGSGGGCSSTPPTQNAGPAIDGCNLTDG